jgi:hypothetical protein
MHLWAKASAARISFCYYNAKAIWLHPNEVSSLINGFSSVEPIAPSTETERIIRIWDQNIFPGTETHFQKSNFRTERLTKSRKQNRWIETCAVPSSSDLFFSLRNKFNSINFFPFSHLDLRLRDMIIWFLDIFSSGLKRTAELVIEQNEEHRTWYWAI